MFSAVHVRTCVTVPTVNRGERFGRPLAEDDGSYQQLAEQRRGGDGSLMEPKEVSLSNSSGRTACLHCLLMAPYNSMSPWQTLRDEKASQK